MRRSRKSRSHEATASNQKTKPLCRNLPRPVPQLSPVVMGDPRRAAAILSTRSKWVSGTVLHYGFFGAGSHFAVPKVQADGLRGAFAKRKAVGVGLQLHDGKQF